MSVNQLLRYQGSAARPWAAAVTNIIAHAHRTDCSAANAKGRSGPGVARMALALSVWDNEGGAR